MTRRNELILAGVGALLVLVAATMQAGADEVATLQAAE